MPNIICRRICSFFKIWFNDTNVNVNFEHLINQHRFVLRLITKQSIGMFSILIITRKKSLIYLKHLVTNHSHYFINKIKRYFARFLPVVMNSIYFDYMTQSLCALMCCIRNDNELPIPCNCFLYMWRHVNLSTRSTVVCLNIGMKRKQQCFHHKVDHMCQTFVIIFISSLTTL